MNLKNVHNFIKKFMHLKIFGNQGKSMDLNLKTLHEFENIFAKLEKNPSNRKNVYKLKKIMFLTIVLDY